MISILSFLVPLFFGLASPAPAPTPTTPAAAAYTPHCPCDIGMKDWGK
jgi:hypothetical protein